MNAPTHRLGQVEFIALIAMLFATVAFSIDAMLPALPDIAAELSPQVPNQAQLILTSFVFGMGLGTLLAGPISDSFGRKPVIVWGGILYFTAAFVAYVSPTLETILAARVVMGLGAAAPRIVTIALVRDLYMGREMARMIGFAMMVFSIVPALAPLMGSGLIMLFGWRSVFLAFMIFITVSMLWLLLRQPETLPREKRRPLRAGPVLSAFREIFGNRIIVTAIAVQTIMLGGLFATLSSTQQIFDAVFDRADSFPLWFGLIAVVASSASFINAKLVVTLGMRFLVTSALGIQIALSGLMGFFVGFDLLPEALLFPAYIIWMIAIFGLTGLSLGNINALALEHVGHIAGMAASINGGISTILAVPIAVPIGLAFNGTLVPLTIGMTILTIAGFALMKSMPRA